MNIVVLGAGAIGSLFGGLLSKENEVVLVGNKRHVQSINKKGLTIKGFTNKNLKIKAIDSIKKIDFIPDVIILSVKSFDTEKTIKTVKNNIGKNTFIVSLQNGLNNIEVLKKYFEEDKIIVCLTTHGVVFSKPGLIYHKGIGKTVLGGIKNDSDDFCKLLSSSFNQVGIPNSITEDVFRDMWIKAIVNSSINPITAYFNCKNGYLLKNPILKKFVQKLCKESTDVAISKGFNLCFDEMIDKTFEVIVDTSDNFSSMLQSVLNNKQTEINSINGIIIKMGEKNNLNTSLNKIFLHLLKN